MNDIPTLRTKRLILRSPTFDDWPAFSDLLQSERAALMGGPYTVTGAWGVYCHGIALWQMFGFGSLSIEDPKTGAYLGQVEINAGPRFPETELGWQLIESAEGQGYAFEAATAMRRWALETRKLDSLVSYIDPENLRSIALAKRLGARRDAWAKPQDPGDLIYRHA
ncbi:MAG: GNAT family N-acetyltransferase [Pseudomonadota bacterium]